MRAQLARVRPLVRFALCLALPVGCGAAPPATLHGDGENRATPRSDSPIPGFVIGSAAQTLVVPLDPAIAAVEMNHLWILDDAATPVEVTRVAFTAEAGLGAPPCPCPEVEGACQSTGTFVDTILPDGPVPQYPGSDCTCITDQRPPCEIPAHAIPPEDIEYDESCACGESEADYDVAAAVSLVGGAIHSAGDGHEGACSGLNLYYAIASVEPRVRAPVAAYPAPDRYTCSPSGGGGGGRPDPEHGTCVRRGEDWTDRTSQSQPSEDPEANDAENEAEYEAALEACYSCTDVMSPQAQVELVSSGSWWRVGWSFMSEASIVEEVRLTPERCPGPADPCGDPAPFPTLAAESESPRTPWWVATDGSAALYATGAGEAALSRPGDAAPVRTESYDMTSVLGVRFHADLRPLLEAYDRAILGTIGAETFGDAPNCEGDDTCAPGTSCDQGVCHAPCTSDASCAAVGMCGAFCHVATGHCLRWIDGYCDENHACEPGQGCDPAGNCIPWEGTFADEDRDFLDPSAGRGWGNRCFAHFQRGELEAAQAACTRGLAVVEASSVEAAIRYNLGRIAEARGWPEIAIAHYETSLELRENATVRARLETLRGETGGADE